MAQAKPQTKDVDVNDPHLQLSKIRWHLFLLTVVVAVMALSQHRAVASLLIEIGGMDQIHDKC